MQLLVVVEIEMQPYQTQKCIATSPSGYYVMKTFIMVTSAETIRPSWIGPFSCYAGTSVPGKSDHKTPLTSHLCGVLP